MTGEADGLRSAGHTHAGQVPATNADALILEPRIGLYAVFDGMGGAKGGGGASRLARDTIRDFVRDRRAALAPKALIEAAIVAASTAVFTAAQQHRERHGMGTTVVACLVVDPTHVLIAHVGDSRAYLLRDGRLQPLTRDHTIVEELVDRGLLAAEEAERHPYKHVLSRKLGTRPEARLDTLALELQPGDRLLLCSDGLHGHASAEAIQYVLGSGDAPEHVARDLIELALRGGSDDNVSTLVIEAPAQAPPLPRGVRTRGALAWWQHRPRFLEVARDGGLADNPIVRGLAPEEAIDLVAGSLCQAIYHDLENSTGVNVWSFAQNLAAGWFERGGDWTAMRGLIDLLGTSARSVAGDIRARDAGLGLLLDVAVSRGLTIIELALGGLLAERLRRIDRDLIDLHPALPPALPPALHPAERHGAEHESGATPELGEHAGAHLAGRPTIPFLRMDRPITSPGESPEVLGAVAETIAIALGRLAPRAELVAQILVALEAVATDGGGSFAAALVAARELYGARPVDRAGVMPLFDALDQARVLAASSVHQVRAAQPLRARALRALSTAHQRLVGATTGLVLEAAGPFSQRLHEAQAVTAELHDAVARAEQRRAELERRFTTIVDPDLPRGARGRAEA